MVLSEYGQHNTTQHDTARHDMTHTFRMHVSGWLASSRSLSVHNGLRRSLTRSSSAWIANCSCSRMAPLPNTLCGGRWTDVVSGEERR